MGVRGVNPEILICGFLHSGAVWLKLVALHKSFHIHENNNEHRRSWGSILYGLLPQYPQRLAATAAPAVWVSPPMVVGVLFERLSTAM